MLHPRKNCRLPGSRQLTTGGIVDRSMIATLSGLRSRRRLAAAARANAQVESLEARRLLSVTAAQLIGPQTVGTQRTYLTTETGVPDETTVDTVAGPATYNGHSATET